MNNGQPPYGDPNAWNQQGNQVNPAQYPVQQNPYQQDQRQGHTQPRSSAPTQSQPLVCKGYHRLCGHCDPGSQQKGKKERKQKFSGDPKYK